MSERQPIRKKVRFEVFKRDLFTCQYCGNKAPDVVLHCDHVVPVASGGTNEFYNLVTACENCNQGKGPVNLSDATAIDRQRRSIEALQEKQNQIAMMIEWRKSLDQNDDMEVDAFNNWLEERNGFSANENGKNSVRKLLRKFSLEEVLEAASISFEQYGVWKNDVITDDSWEKAFSKIGGVCVVSANAKNKTYISEIIYIQGILRRRCRDKRIRCLDLIEQCHLHGATLESITAVAKSVDPAWDFFDKLNAFIDTNPLRGDEAS